MHAKASIATLMAIAVIVAALRTFAPAAIGGSAVYAVTTGSSMQPTYRDGDLAIIRIGPEPHIGDVFAYQTPSGQLILHRIIAADATGYTFQGDNNSWIDSTHPAEHQLVGRLWVSVPQLGTLLSWVRAPLHAAIITGGIIAMSLLSQASASSTPANDLPGRKRWRVSLNFEGLLLAAAGRSGQAYLGICLGTALLASAAGFVAWRLIPSHHEVPTYYSYRQSGQFAYESAPLPFADAVAHAVAAAPVGSEPIDPAPLLANPLLEAFLSQPVHTGEPFFAGINPAVTTTFDYVFESNEPHSLSGTIAIDFTLGDVTGWKRTFPFVPSTPFHGDTAHIVATFDQVGPFIETIKAYELVTGHIARYYTVAVVARVEVDGQIHGQTLEEVFQPSLVYRYSPPNEVFVETTITQKQDAPGVPLPVSAKDPFRTVADASAQAMQQEPNTIRILTAELPVSAVRIATAAIGAVATLTGLFILGLTIAAHRRGEAFMIRARYRHEMIVAATSDAVNDPDRSIQVASIEDLLHVSDLQGSPVLVTNSRDYVVYLVHTVGNTYWYAPAHEAA